MNATLDYQDGSQRIGNAPVAAPHATHRFALLLRREFWEHKGGFFWAPIVAGGIVALLTLLGVITSSVVYQREAGKGGINWDGMNVNGAHGLEAAKHIFGFAGDVTLMMGAGFTSVILIFVVFFYALGSLYDERKDRSVLFWKSLPVSDTQTVLSKALWALVLAPTLAIVIGLLVGVVLWLITAAAMLVNGVPGAGAIFVESHPFRVLGNVLIGIPVYAFWAMPTVGWLMLCSAWARSKPFLWAVLLPILSGTIISWMGSLPGITIAHDKVWYVLFFRGLLSIIPGSWYANESVRAHTDRIQVDSPEDLTRIIDATSSWHAFMTPDLWIGAAVGAAMIFAAIQLRRRRELAD